MAHSGHSDEALQPDYQPIDQCPTRNLLQILGQRFVVPRVTQGCHDAAAFAVDLRGEGVFLGEFIGEEGEDGVGFVSSRRGGGLLL